MSRNGSGTYTLPAGNPVVTGTSIASTWANTTLSDIATALTGSVAADGQTTMTGNLLMGNNQITGLADGTLATDAATKGQVDTALGDYIPVTDIGVTVEAYDATIAKTGAIQTFTKAQRGAVVALTSASTITPDFSASNNYSVTLDTNATLANPTNIVAGQSGVITITQDSTGSRTLAYGSYWKFINGTAPTLSTAANAVDELVYYVDSSTRITAALLNNVG
jgi:hypothetical protein